MKTITYDDTLYQLVPVEPTQEMVDAAVMRALEGTAENWYTGAWRVMLSAAPTPPAQPINLEEVGAQFNSLGQMTHVAQPAERKPLTLDQLSDICPGTVHCAWSDFVSIARAIETAHGIKWKS